MEGATRRPDARLFARYEPLSGVPDELADAEGRMRPVWADLVAHMSGLSPAALEADFARGARHLADAGVFFRGYGDGSAAGRDWPFSPVPVVLSQAEWTDIAAGLVQRADLLEAVVADLYGENRLVRDGHLPAALIAKNPEWLRPMVGVVPRSGHFLHFVAFEIGRGPDGRWWVLSDRTDAPSGAGFALENRVATTRVFHDLFRRINVTRLAGFFGAFREALAGMGGGGRAAILTPGPLTDTYYEQAYIARYLGLTLLEGEDLTAGPRGLSLRTVQGPDPVGVLWRRMDGIWADPLELREDSRLGTPGLMSAVRRGQVTMVNALGVGVLETQALMAFLPAIAELLTGEPLRLPNVATWWCGQTRERDHVRANATGMMIGPAMATRMPYETAAAHAIGGTLRGHAGNLQGWLTERGPDLMGKELVTLSTTPVYRDGGLVPRPMTIRMFLARTARGWRVMPGGFARIGARADASAIAMREGGTVADVWVLADRKVDAATMLTPQATPFLRADAGPLPSRAADNLFWLGRYVERTEGLLRLIRARHGRLAEAAPAPLLALIETRLASFGVGSEPLPPGLVETLHGAVGAANRIRDRFSVDAHAALKDLEKSMTRIARTATPGTDAARAASVMLRKITGFSGLVHDNMVRAAGWQFLTLGRSVERAAMMTGLLIATTPRGAPEGSLDLAIEIGDSVMVHRQRYAVVTSRDTVIDLLALDEANPRAVRFHLDTIRDRAADLTAAGTDSRMAAFDARTRALQETIAGHTTTSLDTRSLRSLASGILALSDALNAAFLA